MKMNLQSMYVKPMTSYLLIGFGLLCALPLNAQESKLLMTTSFDSLKGKFGQVQETEVQSITTGLLWLGKGIRLGVFVPYVSITGPGVLVGGTITKGKGTPTNQTRGIGDMLTTLSIDLAGSPEANGFHLAGTALYKIPTGDEKQGLGTGKSDVALQADLSYRFSSKLGFSATLGRQNYGSTNTLKLNDGNYNSLGVNFALTEKAAITVSVNRRDPITTGSKPRRESNIQFSYAITQSSALQLGVSSGKSQASPDSAFSLGLIFQF